MKTRTIKMTINVYNQIKETIGNHLPEKGGMLGSSIDQDFIDNFVFDEKAKVTSVEYNPSTKFLEDIINNVWFENDIMFVGFIHSHPSAFYRPSYSDIEYSLRLLQALDMDYIFLPIVSTDKDNKFNIYGYVVESNGECNRCKIKIVNSIDTKEKKEDTIFSRIDSCLPIEYLNDCSVIGIGCGGSREFYLDLARMGVGTFYLMDGDICSLTNIGSQNTYMNELGMSKVEAIKNKILQINPNCQVHIFEKMLTNDITDQWLEENIIQYIEPSKTILCGFTDSFIAQARINAIAVRYCLPLIEAQHHEFGYTSELIYYYPEVTFNFPQEILFERYESYSNGYKNTVTSNGSPIFNTTRLNSICEKIAIGLLIYGFNKDNLYCSFIKHSPNKNLIIIRQNNIFETDSMFIELFKDSPNCLFDDILMIDISNGNSSKHDIYLDEDTRNCFEFEIEEI